MAPKDSNSFVTFDHCTQNIATWKNAYEVTTVLGINLWLAKRIELTTAAGLFFFAERTRLCLLAVAFEAMRDRKKLRPSSRFVSADAVAHL
jgi:hypothetical protein